jgi:hypothetical protein
MELMANLKHGINHTLITEILEVDVIHPEVFKEIHGIKLSQSNTTM